MTRRVSVPLPDDIAEVVDRIAVEDDRPIGVTCLRLIRKGLLSTAPGRTDGERLGIKSETRKGIAAGRGPAPTVAPRPALSFPVSPKAVGQVEPIPKKA